MGVAAFAVLWFAVVLFLALRARDRVALSSAEALTVAGFAVLGLLQLAVREEVYLNDVLFGPLYLALPVWLGVVGGASSGFAGAVLGGGAFAIVAAAGSGASHAPSASDALLVLVVLSLIGIVAGLARERRGLVALSCAIWLLYPAAVHLDLLWSLGTWGLTSLAVGVAAAGVWALDQRAAGRV